MPFHQTFQPLQSGTTQDQYFLGADVITPDAMHMGPTPCRGHDPRSADAPPWSHLSAAASVAPRSDQLLFFPDPKAYVESLAPPKPRTREDHGDCDKPVLPSRTKNQHARRESCEGSSSSESVDPPRGDNPVGPPEEPTVSLHNNRDKRKFHAARKLGRRHSLNPKQRNHAALMRGVHNCWHCVFQKYPV